MSEVHMLRPVTAGCESFTEKRRRSLFAEPGLAELMGDPMTQALMAADRVDRRALDALLTQVRDRLCC
jgi:hypothetical protein